MDASLAGGNPALTLCLQPERPVGFGVDVAIVLVQVVAQLLRPLHDPFDRHRNCYRQLATHESTAIG